jgi:hypothetical protein
MLFYNGQIDCEPFYVKDGNNSARIVNQFPYFDNYNVVTGSFPTTNSDSLLFYNENAVYGQVPNDSLYTKYWETYVELLYNPRTRLINASAIIPLADYFKMELNDIVDFRGNYYHLRAINDYNLSNGECKIQLLGPIIPDSLETIRDSYSFCLGYNESNCDLACDDSANCYTTTTTTLAYREWQVGGASGVGDCDICLTCTQNLRTIYTAASVTELALNVFVYTNPALTTPVTQGTWFSDCVKGWAVGAAGRIVSGVSSCSLCTTTTTTSTTTTSTTTSTTTTTTIAPGDYNASTTAFLTAAGISNPTIGNAVNTLVVGMKAEGIWDKMYAVYPFVGGTQSTSIWNLKDTGSYTLSPTGSITYSSNGVQPAFNNYSQDPSQQNYFNTGIVAGLATTPSPANISLGIYSNTESSNGYDIGAYNGSVNGQFIIHASQFADTFRTTLGGASGTNTARVAGNFLSGSMGFFQSSRNTDNTVIGYKNSQQYWNANGGNPFTSNAAYLPLYIGNINPRVRVGGTQWAQANRQYQFAYIGQALTANEMEEYNILVQQFQANLGRLGLGFNLSTTCNAPSGSSENITIGGFYAGNGSTYSASARTWATREQAAANPVTLVGGPSSTRTYTTLSGGANTVTGHIKVTSGAQTIVTVVGLGGSSIYCGS